MGKYDVAMKNYFAGNDRVASICNFCVGSAMFLPENIAEKQGFYSVRTQKGKLSYVQRDILRKVKVRNQEMLIGLENQQNINLIFPVRQLEMDCLEYKKNVEEIQNKNIRERDTGEKAFSDGDDYLYAYRKDDRILPVVTLVLYWGEEEWEMPQKLSDIQATDDLPPELYAFMNDYRMNIISMRNIPDETLEKMDSDLKYVVGLLKRSKDKEQYCVYIRKHADYFRRIPRSAIDVIDVCSGVGALKELLKYVKPEPHMENEKAGSKTQSKEEVANMCQALEDLIYDSRMEGISQGISQGENRLGKLNLVLIAAKKYEELEKASKDGEYRHRLFEQYGI